MRDVLISLLAGLTATLRTRASLQLEILALRHQFSVLQRHRRRVPIRRADRLLWVTLLRFWPDWRRARISTWSARRDRKLKIKVETIALSTGWYRSLSLSQRGVRANHAEGGCALVNDLDPVVKFYTAYLGFRVERAAKPNFAMLSRRSLELVLSTPSGPGGAAKHMPDGRKAEPGGWNRIIINVDDLAAEVARLRAAHLHFRNNIVTEPGGSEILLEDPSGNPVELFQAGN